MNKQEKVTCPVCMHACRLSEGQKGRCRARVCRDGRVVSENYGRLTSLALDPIEKKPLNRFYPGSKILSAGSYGCSLSCAAQPGLRTLGHLSPALCTAPGILGA